MSLLSHDKKSRKILNRCVYAAVTKSVGISGGGGGPEEEFGGSRSDHDVGLVKGEGGRSSWGW